MPYTQKLYVHSFIDYDEFLPRNTNMGNLHNDLWLLFPSQGQPLLNTGQTVRTAFVTINNSLRAGCSQHTDKPMKIALHCGHQLSCLRLVIATAA